MRQLHIAGKEWDDFRCNLDEGTISPGIFLVQGSSEAMASQVQLLLQHAIGRGKTFSYFLCSGSEQFRTSYYLSFAEGEEATEVIDPTYLLYRSSDYTSSLRYSVIKTLEQSIASDAKPHFLIIECLSSPGPHDLAFTAQLLYSPSLRRIPLLFFLHDVSSWSNKSDLLEGEGEALAMLYLCGGRVRETDWQAMIDQLSERYMNTALIASRCLGSETWVCYAHRGVAELARELYSTMSQQRQHTLARRVLQALPLNIGYPLLAIATVTGEVAAMQSKYSRKVVDASLVEPENVISYFDCLHQVSQRAGDDALARDAYTGYLLALLYADKSKSLQIYQQLWGTCLDQINQTVAMTFWRSLGGNLALLSQPEAWTYAANCLRLGRELANALYDLKQLEQDNWRFTLASIANTEALIAYKLGQGEQACQLEEFAIAELTQVPASLFFQVHVRINFGDLFLRLLRDVKSASTQYEAAFRMSLHMSRKSKGRSSLGGTRRDELRAVQKLGDALMLLGRDEEALQLLEALLHRLRKVSGLRKEEIVQYVLKARLTLAKTYLKVGRTRSAIACYWHILRQSDWLTPEVLRDVATRLRTHRPGLSERQQRRIEGIIGAQDEVMADVSAIQQVLSGL